MVMRPSLLTSDGRDSMRQTCSWWSWSSAASSMVTMRSSTGMKLEQTLSSVVLPVPVPPLTTMLALARTHAWMNAAASWVRVPKPMRSLTWYGSLLNFLMVRIGPSSATGAMAALTREPSSRRASHSGERESMRRPTEDTMVSMTRRRCSSLSKRTSVSRILPLRST